MSKKVSCFLILILIANTVIAQRKADTLQEIVVQAYFSQQPVLQLPASVSIINSGQLQNQPESSLVSAVNTVPGVRMEERSPGSYRLSIRGSLLRSPFGIRNVKMYIDEIPLTDAGGNTYLNALDAGSVSRMEILKGPEASVFGANSGGVILISTSDRKIDSTLVSATLQAGSYGYNYEKTLFHKAWKNYSLDINQASQQSNGYRENSALKRNFVQAYQRWQYADKGELRALLLFSDLNYQTPGGLTASQMEQNPRLARPRAGNTPGAIEQKASIFNRTSLAGIVNEFRFSPTFRHVIALYGSNTDFSNPFITNYEVRNESTLGLRTYFELKNRNQSNVNLQWQIGLEGGRTASDITNYDNLQGRKGNTQSSDQLKADQYFFFNHFSATIHKMVLEVAASVNYYGYKYRSLMLNEPLEENKFKAQLMPRIGLSYPINTNFSWRASASRGYSPPTIAEVRSSDNNINTSLEPESGWNYETGFRYKSSNSRFYFDGVIFRYDLTNAIVRRLNANDAEYFVNAGGTKQTGIETQLMSWIIPLKTSGIFRGVQLNSGYTYSHFKFSNYQNASDDYSGNWLTGVPKHVWVNSLDIRLPADLSLFIQHNFTAGIPLNDANTEFSKQYNLFQLKGSWDKIVKGRAFQLFAGVDNIFDIKYSLGNDLNAFGKRYYNPSAPRNYYAGIKATFK
ncbi:TonB-dependent receptor [Rubrolithibacter danxiaensis]|uniref:TonB-dependent receptor n=1 Tax=Rubrolithibacter danxiaensis TaxID=3390805 RepID=UPI003BF88AA5